MSTKQELMDKIRPIMEKGKPINDIIFMSKKMGIFDICWMLKMCRPTIEDIPKPKLFSLSFKKQNEYGWTAKSLYDMVENPVLTGGGDGLEQLLFGWS